MTRFLRVLGRLSAVALAVAIPAGVTPLAASDDLSPRASGAVHLAQLTHGNDAPARRLPGPTLLPPKPDGKPPSAMPPLPRLPVEPIRPHGIRCIGGRVTGRFCVCASGAAVATAPGVFVCRVRPRDDGSGRAREDVPDRGRPRPDRGRSVTPDDPAPRRAAPELRAPRTPAMPPPPSGPARIAPGPAPRPDALALTTADVIVPSEIVATLPAATPETVEDAVAQAFNLELLQRLDIALTAERLVRFRIPDVRTVEAVVAALGADARLDGPQPNRVYRNQGGAGPSAPAPAAAPADLQYALQKVELPAAHELARGRGAVVAVIDSGVDRRHPDLQESVDEEIDVAGGGSGATDVSDPHGTAIAGIIAARGLVKGVAPMARILSVRAFRPMASGAASVSTTAMLVAGIDKAVAKGARVLNMSFSGAQDALVHRLVKAAAARGVLMVAAAGNKGPGAPAAYPAGYPEVVAVTATDAADRLYAQANRGGYVAVAAPGVDVLAPGAARSHQLQSGTSFAAAHVSGVLALMLERRPGLTPADAREALVAGAVDLGAPGQDEEFGAGRISAAAAVRKVSAPP